MQAKFATGKPYSAMTAQERLKYVADDLESYSPCPYSRDVLETWLALQLASHVHTGPDAGRSLDIAYEDWIKLDSDRND